VHTKQQARQDDPPGSGPLFAIRVVGFIFLARWLYSMSESGFGDILHGIGSSPIAMLHLLYLFLLIVLPGARPGSAHPFQPMPRLLRQLLRVLSVAGGLFALSSILFFTVTSGFPALLVAVQMSNGWLVVGPILYFAVAWLCRRRALWRTRATSGRFAIGCLGVAIDAEARTATVWDQNRKIGQYGASELSVHQQRSRFVTRIDLLWSSLAAAGHNRKRVFRIHTFKASDRASATALENALKRV